MLIGAHETGYQSKTDFSKLTIKRSSLSTLFFIIFVISVGLQKSNYLISLYTGINIQQILQISLLTFPIFLLIAAYYFSPYKFVVFNNRQATLTTRIIVIYVFFLLIYGYIQGYPFMNLVWEIWVAALIYFSYKLAASKHLWNLFENKLFILYLFFSFMVLLGTLHLAEHLDNQEFTSKIEAITTATLAYQMGPMLDFWPFVFLICLGSKKRYIRILAYLPVIIYVLFQLFFLKRAPSIRGITFIIVTIGLLIFKKNSIVVYLRYSILLVLFGIVLLTYFPQKLVERFNKDDGSRPKEIKAMFETFNTKDYIIGRGLGGAFVSHNWIYDYFNKETHLPMRIIVHIGSVYPFLKGGAILFLLILIQILKSIFFGLKNLKKLNREQFASLVFLIVYSLFRLIEGPPSTGQIFDGLLFGMSLGSLDLMRIKMRRRMPVMIKSVA